MKNLIEYLSNDNSDKSKNISKIVKKFEKNIDNIIANKPSSESLLDLNETVKIFQKDFNKEINNPITLWKMYDDQYKEALSVMITYKDSSGDISKRQIDISSISNNLINEYFVTAFCHMRNEIRTFKVSNIQELINIKGEIFDCPLIFIKDIISESQK